MKSTAFEAGVTELKYETIAFIVTFQTKRTLLKKSECSPRNRSITFLTVSKKLVLIENILCVFPQLNFTPERVTLKSCNSIAL